MESAETFHSIANIAVAFAGFTGIVLALRKPSDARAAAFDHSRLLDLLFASLGATFFAYLPEVVFAFGVDESRGWRLSTLAFAFFHSMEVAVAAYIAGGTLIFTRLDWILLPIGAVVMLAQWATGWGAFSAYIQAVYLVSLLWFLFVAAYQFAQLLMAHNRPE